MPKQQALTRQLGGLELHYNPFLVSEGALYEADNCVIDREGVAGKRRGFDRYGDALVAAGSSFLDFKDKPIVLDGSTLKYDSDGAGTWSSWTGSFAAPDASTRMRGVEARSNLFFTTSKGVWRNDALANTPTRSGMPQGLDTQVALTGTGGGWFTPDTQVGYRVVWTREDSNQFLVAGAPGFREVATNAKTSVVIDWAGGLAVVTHAAHGYSTGDSVIISDSTTVAYEGTVTITSLGTDSYHYEMTAVPVGNESNNSAKAGKALNVDVTFTIPADVAAGDKYEVYRTQMSAAASTDPADRHLLLKATAVTSGEITAGTVTFADTFDETYLGVDLVTNATQDTILQANDRPPFAKDVAWFKGYLFYLNTKQEHQKELQFLSVANLVAGTSTITITDGTATRTYTAETAEAVGSQEFLLSTAETTTTGNIEATAKSLVKVINRDSGQTAWIAYYISGSDEPSGKILVKGTGLDGAQISFIADTTTTGNELTPALPTSGTTVASDNFATPNRLYHSKFEQPDAAPETNFDEVGTEESPGLRILPLRDSLIILKEEGVWRLSGESEVSFVISQLDPSVKLLAPESAVVIDNSVYCLSTQGVVKINENGTAIISRDIERELFKIFSYTNYKTLTHAVAYETDRKYLLFTQSASGDTKTTRVWCYNYLTSKWTTWTKNVGAAMVLFNDDTLYMAHADDLYVLKERKSFSTASGDYVDEGIAVTIDSVSTTTINGVLFSTATITYTYTGYTMAAGGLLTRGTLEFNATAVVDNGSNSYTLTLDAYSTALTAGAATFSIPILSRIRWAPQAVESPTTMKHWMECVMYFADDVATKHSMGFITDVMPIEETVDEQATAGGGWGVSEWGDTGWGDEDAFRMVLIRVPVPRDRRRSRTISPIYTHRYAKEDFALAQMSLVFRHVGEKVKR